MQIVISETKAELGQRAAGRAGEIIRRAIAERGAASIVVATGASQFETLAELVAAPDIDWHRVTAFHLDEYVGLSQSHPASFRRYLEERFVGRLPAPLRAFHAISGEGDVAAECHRLNALMAGLAIDVALVGIGENGHLAFNDPPADFVTEDAYIMVNLDDACRSQQLGEGWFDSLQDVPQQAISMTIRQIMKSREIVCSVPDERKAAAVRASLQGPVSPLVPASILQHHPAATIYLDRASASTLDS
jgi:glucosamine-6-phosphate deaminase